jgi:hypothetical protein
MIQASWLQGGMSLWWSFWLSPCHASKTTLSVQKLVPLNMCLTLSGGCSSSALPWPHILSLDYVWDSSATLQPLSLAILKNPESKVAIPVTLCKAQWLACLQLVEWGVKGYRRHRCQNVQMQWGGWTVSLTTGYFSHGSCTCVWHNDSIEN